MAGTNALSSDSVFSNTERYEIIPTNAPGETIPPLIERIIEAIVLTCICIVALGGNILLWMVIFRRRSLRTTSNALILCLSTADILVSAVNMPLTIYTLLVGTWRFGKLLCTFQGMFNMTTFIGSVMSLGAISINRYILIVHPHKFRKVYTRRNTAFIIAGVWCLSILLASPPLLGWASYDYLPGQSFCFCNWKLSVSYTFFMVGVCFGGPCSVMTFCYYNILKAFRESQQKFAPTGKEATAGSVGSAKENCLNRKHEGNTNKNNQSEIKLKVDTNENSKTSSLGTVNSHCQGRERVSSSVVSPSLGKMFLRQNSPSNVQLVEGSNGHPTVDNHREDSEESKYLTDDDLEDDKSKTTDQQNNADEKKLKRKKIKWKSPFKTKKKMKVTEPTVVPDAVSTDEFSNPFALSGSVTGLANGDRISVLGRPAIPIKPNASRIAKKKKRREEEMRLTKSFLVVIFVFIICWFPFCITMFWSVFARNGNTVPRVIDMLSLLLGYANSCCNPIIYGVMNKKFRAGFRALLCWWKEKNMVTPVGIKAHESSQG